MEKDIGPHTYTPEEIAFANQVERIRKGLPSADNAIAPYMEAALPPKSIEEILDPRSIQRVRFKVVRDRFTDKPEWEFVGTIGWHNLSL